MIGPGMLSLSAAWLHGMNAGYRLAGRSLFRRFFLALLVWVVLMGSGVGFLWGSADLFSRLATGEEVTKTVIGKIRAWNAAYKPERSR